MLEKFCENDSVGTQIYTTKNKKQKIEKYLLNSRYRNHIEKLDSSYIIDTMANAFINSAVEFVGTEVTV